MHTLSLTVTAIFCLVAATAAADDFNKRLSDAADLCKSNSHEEAIAAYVAIADAEADIARKYEAIKSAAHCLRLHVRSESRAIEVCDRLEDEQSRLACRAYVYQWATSHSRVLTDLAEVDMTAWPDSQAAIGFMVRGNAYYREGDADQAINDFVRAYQFSTGRDKWTALVRLGDTFLNLRDDEILAEACYRNAMLNGGFGASGLQGRANLGNLLIRQGRTDDALKVFEVRPGGTWRTEMLIGTARAQIAANDLEAARQTLAELQQWPDVNAQQRDHIAEIAATLSQAK